MRTQEVNGEMKEGRRRRRKERKKEYCSNRELFNLIG